MTVTIASSAVGANIVPFPGRLHEQLGLFASPSSTTPSTAISGLIVSMAHRPCRSCGCESFVIGSSKAMHTARVDCADCGAFGGWLSRGAFAFIQMTIEKFGPPTTPIALRPPTLDF
jgi:hypothetical protein